MMAVSYACSSATPYRPEGAKAGPLHHIAQMQHHFSKGQSSDPKEP